MLAALTLLGSVVVQGAWIYQGYQQSEMHLHEQLNAALVEAVEDLNAAEEIAFIAKVSSDEQGETQQALRHEVHMIQTTDLSITEDSLDVDMVMGSLGASIAGLSDSLSDSAKRSMVIRMEYSSEHGGRGTETRIEWVGDSMVNEVLELEQEGRLGDIVKRIERENLWTERSWKNRIDSAGLAESIDLRLKQRGIHEPFEFAVVSDEMKVFEGFHSRGFTPTMTERGSRTALFPDDLRVKPLYAVAYVPSVFAHVMAGLWLMILASLLFTGMMVAMFIVILRKLLSQSKLNRMKSDFINNMSHELKTPLATISLATDALQHPSSKGNDALIKTFSDTIKKEHHRMHAHIERVLQMAQSEVGQFHVKKKTTDLCAEIAELVADFELVLSERNATIHVDAPSEPVLIDVDAFHLKSALSNLIDNGIKYNAKAPEIRVTLQQEEAFVLIRVCDNGIGIEPEQQELIFSRFYRVPTGNVHAVKGFGLGLSYVSTVIKAHGGHITLESKPGEGACFTLTLPRS